MVRVMSRIRVIILFWIRCIWFCRCWCLLCICGFRVVRVWCIVFSLVLVLVDSCW